MSRNYPTKEAIIIIMSYCNNYCTYLRGWKASVSTRSLR